jgi:HEAT repeat protein
LTALFICLLTPTLLSSGCTQQDKRPWIYRSPEQNYKTALESESGDQRRDAVVRIAESTYYDADPAFAVLDTLARTDPVVQVRCIAIRAFAHYKDARPIPALLTILQAKPGSDQALPADADIRWETVQALLMLTRRGVLGDDQRPVLRDILIKFVESDPSRSVRITSAEGLGEIKDREVFAPLIRLLRNKDFGIADQAERSLIRLTGVTHDYDANAWEAWVASTQDPFAHAGETPVTTRPAGPTWWDQQTRAWRRAIKLRTD